jgi:hypothetical protein
LHNLNNHSYLSKPTTIEHSHHHQAQRHIEHHDNLHEKHKENINLSEKLQAPIAAPMSAATKENIDKLKLEIEFYSLEPKPTLIEMYLYAYCYIGILTGPYYKYRTYKDWLSNKYAKNVDSIHFITKRGRAVPFIIIGYLILSRFVSFKVKFLCNINLK